MRSDKNKLQELCQKNKWPLPRYESSQEMQPNSNPPVPMFHSTVYVTMDNVGSEGTHTLCYGTEGTYDGTEGTYSTEGTYDGTEAESSFKVFSNVADTIYSTKKQAENAAARGWWHEYHIPCTLDKDAPLDYTIPCSDDSQTQTKTSDSDCQNGDIILIDLDNMSHRVKDMLQNGVFVVGFASPTYHNPTIESLCNDSNQGKEQPSYIFQIVRAELGCKDAADFRMAFMLGDWVGSGMFDKDRGIQIVSRDTGFQELVQCLKNKGYNATWVCR